MSRDMFEFGGSIPPMGTTMKTFRIIVQTYIQYTEYECEADTETEAIRLIKEGDDDYSVDHDGESCFEVLSCKDYTKEKAMFEEQQLQWEQERLERRLKQLKKRHT